MVKLFECAICKKAYKKGKGERFRGTKHDVRQHIKDEHGKKSKDNRLGVNKQTLGASDISSNIIVEGL